MKRISFDTALDESAARRNPPPATSKSKTPKAAAPQTKQQRSRMGKKPITAFVSQETSRIARMLALEQSCDVQDLVVEGLKHVFKKYGKEWKED